MRRIVVAKMLILALWSLYLGIVLSQPSGKEFKHAAGGVRADHEESSPSSPNTKFSRGKAAIPPGRAETTNWQREAAYLHASAF